LKISIRRTTAPQLWPAEQAARINVAGKSTRRHIAQIIDATCIRAVEKPRSSRISRIRKTTRRRRTILGGLILLDNLAG